MARTSTICQVGRRAVRCLMCCLLWFALALDGQSHDLPEVPHESEQFRGPVALVALDSRTAVVANARSGSLSLLDVQHAAIVKEFQVGGSPIDLAVHQEQLLVADRSRSRLVGLEIGRDTARLEWALPLPAEPNSLLLSDDGRMCAVGLPWARQLAFVRLNPSDETGDHPSLQALVPLPFAPGELLELPERSRLVVADRFGGKLAVVCLETLEPIAIHEFPAHNIRGLQFDGAHLLVSHQILNSLAPPRPSDIVWGGMISNGIRWLRLENVLNASANVLEGSKYIQVGDGSRGAGDPGPMFRDAAGRILMALAGVNEVALLQQPGYRMDRFGVGSRPVALLRWTENRWLAANELSCSVSLIDIGREDHSEENASPASLYDSEYGQDTARGVVTTISLGKRPADEASHRGERLFFDARLSRGNWFSCHSCHTEGHSNGGLADTLGDGSEGAAKRVLSLLGVADTAPYAWSGDRPSLHSQVHDSVRSTMQGHPLSPSQADDLVAFLATLKPPPALRPASTAEEHAKVSQGAQLFASLGCQECHAGTTFTSADAYDVGLWDELDNRSFNPPSLRGLGHRSGLFHDMRAANVGEVVARYRHQLPEPLTAADQAALIRYLESL